MDGRRSRQNGALAANLIVSAGVRMFGAAATLALVKDTSPDVATRRKRDRLFNAARADHNRGVIKMLKDRDPHRVLDGAVNSLSNYERKAWIADGKPGYDAIDANQVRAYVGIRVIPERDRARYVHENNEDNCTGNCGCMPPSCAAKNGAGSRWGSR